MDSYSRFMVDAVGYQIQIYTLGTLRVVRDAYTVAESEWQTRQARQLLKILITERPRPVSTDRLIDLLWPDSASQAAATTLRSAINSLRNVLEPERPKRAPAKYIITQNPGYAFQGHGQIWLDVDAFEATLTLAEKSTGLAEKLRYLQAAVDYYTDDYLTSDPYADWARHERERLRERYLTALPQLAAIQAEQGDYTTAIATVRQVLTRDPVRENAYQLLMRYQAESGDSASALLTYERCRTLLAEELGADPSPLTQAWHQRILNGEVGPNQVATAVLPTAPTRGQPQAVTQGKLAALPQQILLPVLDEHTGTIFVGRTAEMAEVTARLQLALQGTGGLLVLDGEAGVGKTRLAYHGLQWAAQAGATILSATCQPLEQQLPFAPLSDTLGRYLQILPDDLLLQLPTASLAQLAQLIPSLQDRLATSHSGPTYEPVAQNDENRQRVIDSMIALLAALAKARPVVLFLDDLQWADNDTLAVLSRLAPRLPRWSLFVLLAYRIDDLAENEELTILLHTLRRTHQSLGLTVSRLAPTDVQSYIEQMTGQNSAVNEPLAAALYQTTQGNALFVTEALRDLQERHDTNTDPDAGWVALSQWWLEEQPPAVNLRGNPRVQEIILERIHRLSPTARDLLHLAAVIGRDFSLDLLERTALQDPVAALEILLQRRFLVERPNDRLDFSHQLVRQVAYDTMFVLQRRRLHLRVADALAASSRSSEIPGEIAFHYRQAGASASLLLAQYTVLTGERLLRTYGFRQAIDAFDEALSILETTPASTPDWVRRALEGRGLAYEALFDPVGVTAAYRRLQQWAHTQGNQQLLLTAHSRLTAMLSLLGQQHESNELLRELLEALADNQTARSAVMVDLFRRRQRIYAPDASTASDNWATFQPPPPPVADAPAEILQSLSPLHAALPLFIYGWILRIQGQLPAATHTLQAVIDLAKTTGQPIIAGMAYHQLAIAARMQGDERNSHTLNDQSVAINRAMQGAAAELASMWPRISSAFMALQRNDLAEAERRLRRVANFLGDQDLYRSYRNSAQIGLGLVALARGEHAAAQTQLQSALADPVNLYPYIYVQGLLGLATIANHQGNAKRCRQILQQALAYAGQRSLVEEYVEAVLAIANLCPDQALFQPVLPTILTYVEAAALTAASHQLHAALAHEH